MVFLGEILALCTSFLWTGSALLGEISGKRIGAMSLNVWTILVAFLLLNLTLFLFTGNPFPQHLDFKALSWIVASGLLGFVICNFFIYNAYILISARFGQLFMTLTAPSAALTGWILLDEKLTLQEYIGIIVTISGIIITLLGNKNKSADKSVKQSLSVKGIVFAIIASLAQGIGLVLGKVGMIYYHESMPAGLTKLNNLIPLSASYIRVMTGVIGLLLLAVLLKDMGLVKKSVKDKKGFWAAIATGCIGPFLGASCALIAMRYSKAGIAATLLELTPILIIIPSHYIFKQKIYALQVIGTAICIIGVSLFFIKI